MCRRTPGYRQLLGSDICREIAALGDAITTEDASNADPRLFTE
jgi:hypothetical protein